MISATESYREWVLEYFDQIAPVYGVRHGADLPGGSYGFTQLYRKVLSPCFRPGMDVLELGCGNGASSEMLASFGVNLTATDVSENMLKIASTRNLPNTRLRRLDAMKLETAQDLGTFDVIVAFDCFSYLPHKGKVLRDLRKHLKPGGSLIFIDLNALCPIHPISALMGRNAMKECWKTIREMTPSRLRAQFLTEGYRLDELRSLNFVPHAAHGSVYRVLKTMDPILEKLPAVSKFGTRILIRARYAASEALPI